MRATSISKSYMNGARTLAPIEFRVYSGDEEIPAVTFYNVYYYYGNDSDRSNPRHVAIALPIITDYAETKGAETALRKFVRQNPNVLLRVKLSNGEIYYGNSGIVLDKDFNVLLLVAYVVGDNTPIGDCKRIIHIHPKVFTEENSINKTLAKKGVAFYLSRNDTHHDSSVVIDDSSKFFHKIEKPHTKDIKDNFKTVLRDNIDEILRQLSNDFPV